MKIEDKIKEEASLYEIKTTSSDILSAVVPHRTKKPWFVRNYRILTSVFAVLVVLIALPFALQNMNSSQTGDKPDSVQIYNSSNKLNDSSLLSTMSIQLFYGGHMIQSENQTVMTSYQRESVSQEDFIYAQNSFNSIYPIVEPFYSHSTGLESKYESTTFVYDSISYSYFLEVDSYKLYLKEDILSTDHKIDALYSIEDTYYLGTIQSKQKDDEFEIEMLIQKGTQEIKIERNFEKTEYSIEYEITEDGKMIESYEIEMEYEDDVLVCSYEYKSPTKELEVEMTPNLIGYQIKYEEKGTKSIQLEMTYNVQTKEYSLIES